MSKHINELLIKVRQFDEMYQFVKESKQYYYNKAFSKIEDEKWHCKIYRVIDLAVSFLVESLAKVINFWNNE